MNSWEIIHGDCIKVLAKLTKDRIKADLIFADPPYNINLDYGVTTNDRRPSTDYLSWCRQWLGECYINIKDNGSLWVLSESRWGGHFQVILEEMGIHYRETIIWVERFGNYCERRFGMDHRPIYRFTKDPKNQIFHPDRVPSDRQLKYNDKRANPNGRVPSNVWNIPRVCGTHKERIPGFPTQLPLKLLKPIVSCASNPGDLVIDPFSGSGTTLVACLELDRRAIGIEINPDYVRMSNERLSREYVHG